MNTIRLTAALLLLATSSHAFTITQPSFGFRVDQSKTFMSEAATTETIAKKPSISTVRKTIDGLTKDNFSSTLKDIEPFLLEEAGISFYTKSLKRIARRGKVLGVSVPENYGKEAKATAKRREKQDKFVKAKIEEVKAAEAEAAEAAEAAKVEAAEAAEAAAAEAAAAEAAAAEEAASEEAAPEEAAPADEAE